MISAGSDTYGRVKNVDGTPVVTKFVMLSAFPVMPIESFYFAGFRGREFTGVPVLAWIETTKFSGLPLARIDKLSVLMAYFRAFCGALALVGFIVIVPGIMWLTGEHLDPLAIIFTRVLVGCLVVGTSCGLLSYLLPFQVTARERAIRRTCNEIVGIAADPALLKQSAAESIAPLLSDEPLPAMSDCLSRDTYQLNRELVDVRLRIARGEQREPLERRTDQILAALDRKSAVIQTLNDDGSASPGFDQHHKGNRAE